MTTPTFQTQLEQARKRLQDKPGPDAAFARDVYDAALAHLHQTAGLEAFREWVDVSIRERETVDGWVTEAMSMLLAVQRELNRHVPRRSHDTH